MTVTWLHISDFHFKIGDPYDRNVVLKALVQAVRREASQGWSPDVIFATGDVAHSGQLGEYELATEFFTTLLAAAELDRSRLFVIPGNHDVDRGAAKGLQRSLSSESESVEFFGPGHPQHHFAKLKGFRDWYAEYFENVRHLRPRTTCETLETIDIRGSRLTTLGINSALFSVDDHDFGQLWVGRRSLDDAVDALRAEDADLTVALIHHPLEWLHDAEQSNVKSKLRENVDLILRGHLHRSEVESVSTVGAGALHMAAGASYQTREYPNLVLFGRADIDRGRITVRPLRYGDTTERWTLDTDLFPTSDYHGTFAFEPKRQQRVSHADRTPTSRDASMPTLFLLGSAGGDTAASFLITTCLIVDDEATLATQLESVRREMLQEPYFRRDDDVRKRLADGRLPFDSADTAIRVRILAGLSRVTFEAYVCYGEKAVLQQKLDGDILDRTLGRLLFERIQAHRRDNITIELDHSIKGRLQTVCDTTATIIRKLSAGAPGEPVAMPTVDDHDNVTRTGIADYVASVVERRLTDAASSDARAFDQLRPKIRVMHDYGRDIFYTRKNPFGV